MDSNTCQTCLSKGRRLIPQRNLSALFQEINIWEIKESKGGICWECHRMLMKLRQFKAQVSYAQECIIYMVQDLKPLSRLTTQRKTCYDYQFTHSDSLKNNNKTVRLKKKNKKANDHHNNKSSISIEILENDLKTEIDENSVDDCIDLYQEDDFTNTDVNTNISDDEKPILDIVNRQKLCETIYTEAIVPKRKQRLKKTTKIKKESDDADVREKFSTIVFTVEEMLRNREEKRNHPNFKKIPFKCDSCVLGFTRKETYDVHMEKKHSEKTGQYICDVCLIRFPNKKAIERHCHKHLVRYRCRLCKYATVELWSALSHCRVKHSADERDSIHCGQCPAVAKSPEALAEHIRTQHSLRCHKCGEKFKGKHTLRTHMTRIHSIAREFLCDICSRAFRTKSRLESHMVTHAPALARRLAYCDACRVQYKSIYVYRSHVRNSACHNERAYPCPECGKKFVSKDYWTKHYNFYHLRKSEFKCETCNKIFISDWRLKNHRQIHHGLSRPRDHPCNVCGKKFYTQSMLRGHQLTHSSERKYMCAHCGDTFKQRPALYTHTRLVHQGLKRGS